MANIVQTTLHWPDGGETKKVIDMDDPKARRRFAKLAHRCLLQNGRTECVGQNNPITLAAAEVLNLAQQAKSGQ